MVLSLFVDDKQIKTEQNQSSAHTIPHQPAGLTQTTPKNFFVFVERETGVAMRGQIYDSPVPTMRKTKTPRN